MDLTVIDEAGTKTEQVSVPDTIAAGPIAARLAQLMELPGVGPDGRSLSYGFVHEGTGRQVGEEQTLAQAGVSEHDTLRLLALTAAPRQPSAPRPPPTVAPVQSRATVSHRAPPQMPPPPETAVLSPHPPPPPPRQQTMGGGRWSPSIAIAIVVLAVALVGVAVAVALRDGGHAQTHVVLTSTVASSEGSTTGGGPSGEQQAGKPGESATPTTTPTTTAGEGTLPAVSTQQMGSEIQQILLSWHEDVVHGDYRAAWDLLSRRKQAQEEGEQGYTTWKKNQSTLRPYLNPAGLRVSVQSTEPSSGVARVDLTGMTWDKPGASCGEWSGITWVKYENGEWRYDPGYSTTAQREREWKPRFSELLGGSC